MNEAFFVLFSFKIHQCLCCAIFLHSEHSVSLLSNLWTAATVCCANRERMPKIWRITWTAGRTWSPPSCPASCLPSSCRTTGTLSRPRPRCSSGRRTWRRSRGWGRSSWRRSPTAWICEGRLDKSLLSSPLLKEKWEFLISHMDTRLSSWLFQRFTPYHDFLSFWEVWRRCGHLQAAHDMNRKDCWDWSSLPFCLTCAAHLNTSRRHAVCVSIFKLWVEVCLPMPSY